ncbi:L-rhamnose/proton symporter RhaT [Parapedobacter sp. 10938]|uniref:L-rhamnose/proton symporter RhaT n=1 Tax=Parapedobacter flavus TaxID=3110225 RepID=UPI002DBED54D|nr:L-rhamnose/proton symporter RhaT [Parapedobacter sp. 10938]MEC3879521.1 L-rhamnose/proton symporter RhaT [Parapedobacter sp. 10938]
MEQLIGIIFHSIGGFSSASFYVPYSRVRKWAWSTYWIVLGFVAWIIMPTIGGWVTTTDLFDTLRRSPADSKWWTYFFGALWGFGGLMSGLGLRYLGLSLGQSISLGVCAIFGTLVPAYLDGKMGMLVSSLPGIIILVGFILTVVGIGLCGYAGVLKDAELNGDQKKEAVKEFSAVKGLTMAILGGVMSAFMALAINAGEPIAREAVSAGTAVVFMNIPIFVFALAGGFTTNAVYSVIQTVKNRTYSDFTNNPKSIQVRNYFLALLSGVMWYGQYFFYGIGATKMGQYDFASWSLHMAAIIIFSNLWGLWLKEWKLVGKRTLRFLWAGIILLVFAVICIGGGNHLAGI